MEFTHFDKNGAAVMVDVSNKSETDRTAVACGGIRMKDECFKRIQNRDVKKGDVLGIARVAGIMAAKKTSDLIPLCHNLNLTSVSIEFEREEAQSKIMVTCSATTTGKTGVEMEALTGASVALLTIYDMCKAVDKKMEIEKVYLKTKSGGKSGDFCNDEVIL